MLGTESIVYGLATVCALVFLVAISLWAGLRIAYHLTSLHFGPWISNWATGAASANPWLRAHVALKGLMALNASEAVYFTATKDDEGISLNGQCCYLLEGKPLPSAWWSLTVYGNDLFLIPNEAERFSFCGESVRPEPDGSFRIYLSPRPVGENWLPSGGESRLTLTMRYYRPAFGGINSLRKGQLPRIKRLQNQ